ncbi:transcriptional regulator, LysR family [Actinobacteria bacterium OK074]|nr:transcriptional regulator, LysR family [Actinobacteria bacterium OK074]
MAEHGGISAAAQRLGYAQSSVSAQLKRLEAALGVAVLVCGGTDATLTEAGERLLPYAREALELEDRMRRAVLGDRPRLRIGAQESLAHVWMPEVLAALEYGATGSGTTGTRRTGPRTTGPATSVADTTLTVANRTTLEQSFVAGELDLVFHYDNGARTLGPHAVVGHDRTVLVAAPGHPLTRQEPVAPHRLLEYDFLVAEPGRTTEMLVDHVGRDLLEGAQLAMVQGSLSALLKLTGYGHGVSLLPEPAVARELEAGELVEVRLTEHIRPVGIVAQWRPRLGPSEHTLRALLDVARGADPQPEATRDGGPARAS